jgi:hypothetical protein
VTKRANETFQEVRPTLDVVVQQDDDVALPKVGTAVTRGREADIQSELD